MAIRSLICHAWPICCCRLKPIRWRSVLVNLSVFFVRARGGFAISEVDLCKFEEDAGVGCAARAVPGVDDLHSYADAVQRFCVSAVLVCVVCRVVCFLVG